MAVLVASVVAGVVLLPILPAMLALAELQVLTMVQRLSMKASAVRLEQTQDQVAGVVLYTAAAQAAAAVLV
tara:strand:+ start:6606 stop:6818 length:213 start_codon:yes stop_codon:yes gene_type:complete